MVDLGVGRVNFFPWRWIWGLLLLLSFGVGSFVFSQVKQFWSWGSNLFTFMPLRFWVSLLGSSKKFLGSAWVFLPGTQLRLGFDPTHPYVDHSSNLKFIIHMEVIPCWTLPDYFLKKSLKNELSLLVAGSEWSLQKMAYDL